MTRSPDQSDQMPRYVDDSQTDWLGRLAALGNLANLGRSWMGRANELTPQQVADLLGVSASTVRRYEDNGVLKPVRRLPGSGHRRYDRAAVERLLAETEGGAGEDQPAQE